MARPAGERPGAGAADDDPAAGTPIRLDRWLCHARIFKTRTLAADRVAAGGIRVNGQPCRKPAALLRPGDVVTAAVPGGVRLLRVIAPGTRRGPPSEARLLYEDLDRPDQGSDRGPHPGHEPDSEPGEPS